MNRRSFIALGASIPLAACAGLGESRFNPLNWFKRSREEEITEFTQAAEAARQDPRPLVSQVTDMTVEQTPGGAIVTATGLPPTQGYFEADLIDETDAQSRAQGAILLAFRMVAPETRKPQGTPRSRQITTGAFLTEGELAGVSRIIVIAQNNQRVARR